MSQSQPGTRVPFFTCRRVTAPEVVPALRLILGSDGQLAEEAQARELMKFTAQRGINLADIWISVAGEDVYWSALPVVSPGRTVLFFGTSATLVGADTSAMDQGIEAICQHFGALKIQLAQVLLDPADQSTIAAYERHAFRRMADLLYLQRTIRRSSPPPLCPVISG